MCLFTKNELRILKDLSDASFAFMVCEKLLQSNIHVTASSSGNVIINEAGEEYENSELMVKFFVERLLFKSNPKYCLERNLEDVIKRNFYIFQIELSSNDALVAMLK